MNQSETTKNPGGITEISPEVADPGIQCRSIPCIPAGMPEDSASPRISGLSAIPAGIERAFASDTPGCIRVADDPALISPIPPGSMGLPGRPLVPIAIRDTCAKGLGVFADSHIPQGTHIFTLTGERTDYDTVLQRIDQGCLGEDDPLHAGEGVFLILDPLSNLFNHSCDPNLGLRNEGDLLALRDIAAGEELCFDYSTSVPPGWSAEEWSMPCFCGSAACRKVIGNVLTLPEERLDFYQRMGALTSFVFQHLSNGSCGQSAHTSSTA